MDENLVVISYWKTCGLSQNEIDETIENTLNASNLDLIEICKTDAKKNVNSEKPNNEQHLDSVQNLNESIEFNEELMNDLKSFEWQCLLPSNCLKNSEYQIADIGKLDKVFQSSFEIGMKHGQAGLNCEIKHDEDFDGEHGKLYKAWSDAGYKTGIILGQYKMPSSEAEKDCEI